MKKLSLLLFIILLTGCTWSLDKQSAINWWNNNEVVALEILELLKSTPLIERVEVGTRKELIKNYKEFDDKTWETYRNLEKIIRENPKLEDIVSYKFDNSVILELIFDRYGYAIGEGGGCYLSIVYYNNTKTYEEIIEHVVYSEKLKPNWYLEINGDKECIRHAQ